MKLIIERPKGMSFEKYRRLRAESNRNLKAYLSGNTRFVWVSVMLREIKRLGKIVSVRQLVKGTFYGSVQQQLIRKGDKSGKWERMLAEKPSPIKNIVTRSNMPNPALPFLLKVSRMFGSKEFWCILIGLVLFAFILFVTTK